MKRPVALLLVAVLAATAAAYLPAVDGPFLFDDHDTIADPLVVAPPADLRPWLAAPRPLGAALFALNHAAVGLDPRGWHLTSLGVHLAAVLLAFLVARLTLARAGLERPALPAVAAAALFALHPLQTEAVAYVTQRTELLAAALLLLGLWLLLLRDGAEARRRPALLAGAAAAQALGLLAKPTAAVLPALWLLHAALLPLPAEAAAPWWRRVRARLPAAAPLLALAALAAARGLAQARGSGHAGFAIPDLPAGAYLATQLRAVPAYLRLALWPAGQCADAALPAGAGALGPAALAGGLLLLALAGGALLLAARVRGRAGDLPAAARTAAFGALLFLVALSPTSLVPLRDPLAEHRAYLALLGLALGAAGLGAAAARRLAGPRALPAGAALALAAALVLGALTARRAAVWADDLAFWTDAAAKAPGKARVHMNLGEALLARQRQGDALAELRRARDLAADGSVEPATLLKNLVGALGLLGRVDEARGELHRALRARPDDPDALALLAEVELRAGRPEASEAAAVQALRRAPANGLALKTLGTVRLSAGDLRVARDAFRRAVAAGELDPFLHLRLGEVEERLGDLRAACAAYARGAGTPGNAWASAQAGRAHRRLGCR